MGLFGTSSPFDPLLDKTCNENVVTEDWSLILSICDKARASPKNAKDCLTSITKKIQHKIPRVALQALVVLDAATSNAGREFQRCVCSQEFINELRPVVGRTDLVGEKCKELILKWTKEFEHDSELSMIVSFYHFLRANGTHFPEPKSEKRPTTNNPDAVDSQKEADDLAIALQLSLQEEESKKQSAKVKEQNQAPSLYYSTLQTSPNAEPKTQIKVKALYDFEAVEDNELTFKADDIIILIEECDPNWWEGSLNGKSGLFPANFVTKTLNVKTEPPKKTENKVVIKVDEALLDKTLEQVESADPSEETDSPEMLQNEEICSKMGAIIDSKLSEMDTEQLELTQLNEKILQCLQLYDSLMQDQLSTMNTSYMPQMTNSMASMSLQYPPGVHQYAPPQSQLYAQGYQPVETPQPADMNHHGMQQGYQPSHLPQRSMMGNPPAQGMYMPPNSHQQPNPHQQQYITPPSSAYSSGSPYSGPYEPTAPPPTPPVTDPSVLQHHHQQVQAGYQPQMGYQQQQGFDQSAPGGPNQPQQGGPPPPQHAPPQQSTQPQTQNLF